MPIINRIAEFHREMTEWRQDLHAHPELALQETRTSGVVQTKLKEFGVDEIITGMARTGVVGVIRGQGASDRAIGLRADMDALPILEETGATYALQNQGVMHACGHDGHTTMLLGAAKYLAETRNFDGTVYVIFQPAEENMGGGAIMVKEGLFERCKMKMVFGMHNWRRCRRAPLPGATVRSWRRWRTSRSPSPARARTARSRIWAPIPSWSPATSSPRCRPSSRARLSRLKAAWSPSATSTAATSTT
jgi:metal-dependent amidase/aminoacylase/carboxypeptidase family protein